MYHWAVTVRVVEWRKKQGVARYAITNSLTGTQTHKATFLLAKLEYERQCSLARMAERAARRAEEKTRH